MEQRSLPQIKQEFKDTNHGEEASFDLHPTHWGQLPQPKEPSLPPGGSP